MRAQVIGSAAAATVLLSFLVYCSPSDSVPVDADAGSDSGAVCDDSGANCPCDPAKNKTPTDCYTGPRGSNGKGTCLTGKRTCVPDGNGSGTFSACVGEVIPVAEICDYIDNDCNGVIDDVAGTSALSADAGGATPIDNCQSPGCDQAHPDGGIDCFAGAARNACKAGNKVCGAGRQLTCKAYGDIVPQAEVCNGWDDDCNDQVDDGVTDTGKCDIEDGGVWPPGQNPFDGGMPTKVLGECVHGQSDCQDGGLVCQPSQPTSEVQQYGAGCDGKDNDCNGKVDDHACSDSYDVQYGQTYCCEDFGYFGCDTLANQQYYSGGCKPAN